VPRCAPKIQLLTLNVSIRNDFHLTTNAVFADHIGLSGKRRACRETQTASREEKW
jgi:hypothetical protein